MLSHPKSPTSHSCLCTAQLYSICIPSEKGIVVSSRHILNSQMQLHSVNLALLLVAAKASLQLAPPQRTIECSSWCMSCFSCILSSAWSHSIPVQGPIRLGHRARISASVSNRAISTIALFTVLAVCSHSN